MVVALSCMDCLAGSSNMGLFPDRHELVAGNGGACVVGAWLDFTLLALGGLKSCLLLAIFEACPVCFIHDL